MGQAHPSLHVGSGVRVQSLARTNVICTGGTLSPGEPRGFHDPWSLSQDTQVDKMGKPFQIRNTWPLRGKEKVLLLGATLKAFLGRQKTPGFFLGRYRYTSPLTPCSMALAGVVSPHSVARNFVRAPRLCQEFPKHAKVYRVWKNLRNHFLLSLRISGICLLHESKTWLACLWPDHS